MALILSPVLLTGQLLFISKPIKYTSKEVCVLVTFKQFPQLEHVCPFSRPSDSYLNYYALV